MARALLCGSIFFSVAIVLVGANEEWVRSLQPQNYTETVGGFWFGTQTLPCAFAMGRIRRSVPTRSTTALFHSLIFYDGFYFEWGMTLRVYHIGRVPAAAKCPITWEPTPAGVSQCDVNGLAAFTRNYWRNFGIYNLITNNCHHFANRAAELLTSSNCQIPVPPKTIWRRFFDFSET